MASQEHELSADRKAHSLLAYASGAGNEDIGLVFTGTEKSLLKAGKLKKMSEVSVWVM
ncbi:hypothetical protein [Erwinia sp.]|uniref:hypothetical protein n=1 Tax=Erwinia citreus TaxID=558 RepID=UPI00289B76CD|nr:hypothetical protein [Erwinia sp.]